MRAFLAITFYMGLVKKSDLKHYWSVDTVLETPFVRSVMPRDKFMNILSFFHLNDNNTYAKKGQDGYDPRKKLGELFTSLTRSFAEKWVSRQNLSIDEGCIAFKGRVSFKCYNGSKIDKYHIKSYKVVDSSNNYCLQFDLYVGDIGEPASKYGKTHDLVMRLCEPYLGASYNIYMDNYYTSQYYFLIYLVNKLGQPVRASKIVVGYQPLSKLRW